MNNTSETEHFACALQMQSMQNQIEELTNMLRNAERGLATMKEQRDRLAEAQNLLKQCLSAMPVGYIPTHTAENLPEMIGDLAKALAEETTEREKLERECERAQVERNMLVAAGKLLAEEYEDRRSQWGDEYLWKKWEHTDDVNVAIAIFNAAKCEGKTNIDNISCPECDALASHGCNDGPCETHKL